MKEISRRFFIGCAVSLLGIFCTTGGDVRGDENVPKLLYIVVETDRLIASNIYLSRFDEFRLRPEEVVLEKAVADAVAVIVTNKRLIAYAVYIGSWNPKQYRAGEKVLSLQAQDYSAMIVTSDRVLNFNGRSGVWAQTMK
jgi:hypothetical protein